MNSKAYRRKGGLRTSLAVLVALGIVCLLQDTPVQVMAAVQGQDIA